MVNKSGGTGGALMPDESGGTGGALMPEHLETFEEWIASRDRERLARLVPNIYIVEIIPDHDEEWENWHEKEDMSGDR